MPRKPQRRISTNPLDLYERAVTDAAPLARFLRAVHGKRPRTLGEDFSGTAALARAWIALDPAHRAIAVDSDKATLAHIASTPRLTTLARDVMKVTTKADIIAATNFPIMYWHTRDGLLAYLRHVSSRLNKHGVFAADLYGGPSAHTVCTRAQRIPLARGVVLQYTWDQRSVEPLTGRVFNAIHFRITQVGKKPVSIRNAFTYDWRLWSIAELRDALDETGFRTTEVHDRLGSAIDHEGNLYVSPSREGDLDPDWVVYVIGRK